MEEQEGQDGSRGEMLGGPPINVQKLAEDGDGNGSEGKRGKRHKKPGKRQNKVSAFFYYIHMH